MKKALTLLYTLRLTTLSGVLMGLSVNHVYGVSFAFLLPVCLVPLFFSLEQEQKVVGWLGHGWLFSLVSLSLALLGFTWVSPLAGMIMVAAASCLYALPYGLLYAARGLWQREPAWSFLLFGLIWPPFEWFVKELLVGFPITLYANALANYPVFIQYIDITGYTAISTWVITFNVFIFIIVKYQQSGLFKTSKRPYHVAIAALVWFAFPPMYAVYIYHTIPNTYQGSIKATVVQPGYASEEEEYVETVLKSALDLTELAIQNDRPDLVVWPEAHVPVAIRTDSNALFLLLDRVLRWQTPLATGVVDLEPTPYPIPPLPAYLGRTYYFYNAVAMLTPQFAWPVLVEGESGNSLRLYRKVNVMPFTEYVPLSDRFPALSRFILAFGEHNHLQAGESSPPHSFLTQDQRIVHSIPLICWDVLFASTHDAEHLEKAQFITAHTSGRLFGDQLKTSIIGIKNYTRLRSVETRKSIVKSSTTGYSFFTNPFGEVINMIDAFEVGYSTAEVPLRQGASLFSRFPHAYPSLCLVMLVLYGLRSRKRVKKILK